MCTAVFTSLIEGARAIRIQLVAGYSAVLTGYIVLHGQFADRERWTGGAAILGDLYSSFGAAGRAAFWAFVALILGSVISNLFFNSLVAWAVKYPKAPPWTEFIDEARLAVREYEEYTVVTQSHRDGTSVATAHMRGDVTHIVPSRQHAEFLSEEVEDRERRFAEVQFRMALALGLVPPALVLALRSGAWWLLCLLPSTLIWIDMGRMQDRTRSYMRKARRAAIIAALSEVDDLCAGISAAAADLEAKEPRPTDYERRRASFASKLAGLVDQKQIELNKLKELEVERDELFSVRRKSPRATEGSAAQRAD